MKRVVFKLTNDERYRFRRLKSTPTSSNAFPFWEEVAKARGFDPKSIMWTDGELSALPLGHNKWWCYPVPLKCKVDPATVEI